MPRPRFIPTDEQRRLVKSLAAIGTKQCDIAPLVGVRSEKTLRKYFRQELDLGELEANGRVAQALYQMATSGKNVAAMMFWLKCRAGWRERPHASHAPSVLPPFNVGVSNER
jgi:hypothetical protein